MTEKEWLASADARPMLEVLRGNASDRKLRLFACACGRRSNIILNNKQADKVIDLAERVADRDADSKSLWNELALLQEMVKGHPPAGSVYQGTMGIALAIGSLVLATGKPDFVLLHVGLNGLAATAAWHSAPHAKMGEDDVWPDLPHDPLWRHVESEERKGQVALVREIIRQSIPPRHFRPLLAQTQGRQPGSGHLQ